VGVAVPVVGMVMGLGGAGGRGVLV
jgi:hypothetical protein